MPREGTKAAEIMRLYAEGLTTTEIAEKVECSDSYVRVVARQRKGAGRSAIDRRYETSALGRSTRSKMNASRLAAKRAYYHAFARTGDREAARRAYREARNA